MVRSLIIVSGFGSLVLVALGLLVGGPPGWALLGLGWGLGCFTLGLAVAYRPAPPKRHDERCPDCGCQSCVCGLRVYRE